MGRRGGSRSPSEFDPAESTCVVLASSSCTSCPPCGMGCRLHDTVRSGPIREPLLGKGSRHKDHGPERVDGKDHWLCPEGSLNPGAGPSGKRLQDLSNSRPQSNILKTVRQGATPEGFPPEEQEEGNSENKTDQDRAKDQAEQPRRTWKRVLNSDFQPSADDSAPVCFAWARGRHSVIG